MVREIPKTWIGIKGTLQNMCCLRPLVGELAVCQRSMENKAAFQLPRARGWHSSTLSSHGALVERRGLRPTASDQDSHPCFCSLPIQIQLGNHRKRGYGWMWVIFRNPTEPFARAVLSHLPTFAPSGNVSKAVIPGAELVAFLHIPKKDDLKVEIR